METNSLPFNPIVDIGLLKDISGLSFSTKTNPESFPKLHKIIKKSDNAPFSTNDLVPLIE